MNTRAWIAGILLLLVAELATWALAGSDRLEAAVLEDLVDTYVDVLSSEGAQRTDFLFVCPELERAAGSEAVSRAGSRLRRSDVELIGSRDLRSGTAPPEEGKQYVALCATVTTNTPIVATLEISDGYGSSPGYGYRRQRAYLHLLGSWWPVWQWGGYPTVF